MDQHRTPVLEAIERYRDGGNHTFALPGHRLGEGVDERTAAVLSRGAFRADVITDLDLEQAMTPRDAFFAETEQVADPAGRISAEMISPYPPGVPAILPGERFNPEVAGYLRAGVEAGMVLPDASDPSLRTFRVVR